MRGLEPLGRRCCYMGASRLALVDDKNKIPLRDADLGVLG